MRTIENRTSLNFQSLRHVSNGDIGPLTMYMEACSILKEKRVAVMAKGRAELICVETMHASIDRINALEAALNNAYSDDDHRTVAQIHKGLK